MVESIPDEHTEPSFRELLFGDLPLSVWPGEIASIDSEPWLSFAEARKRLRSGDLEEGIRLLRRILDMPGLESRHYLQAWHFLREAGVEPSVGTEKKLLAVVVEVSLREGLDILAAYADGTARYLNYTGAAVVWDASDPLLRREIEALLRAGQTVVNRIGPWEGPRPGPPPAGQVRINMLTPQGLHFGQAPFEVMDRDPLGAEVLSAATRLMQSLTRIRDSS